MRKWLSVLALDVRGSIYKVIGILPCMAAAQAIDFYLVFQKQWSIWQEWAEERIQNGLVPFTMERALEDCHMQIIFIVAMIALEAALIWSAGEHGKVKTRETLWRLRVNPRGIFLIWTLYHIFCFLMLFTVQVLLMTGAHQLYLTFVDADMAPQVLFMAFARDNFLHGLMPFEDILKNIRNMTLFAAWGAGTVYCGYVGFQRHYKRCSAIIAFLVITTILVGAGTDVRWMDILMTAASLSCVLAIGISVKGVWGYEMGES